MISIDEKEHYLTFDEDAAMSEFLAGFIPLRAGLLLDPGVVEPWNCDSSRCRARMGRNLCCKVDTRCRFFSGELCTIHEVKPFSCALFPLDLWRVGGKRILVSAKNPIPYARGWSRYDRDMLRCFEGEEGEGPSMVEVQKEVLAKVFTRAELALILAAVGSLRIKTEG